MMAFDSILNLSALDGSNGFVLNGIDGRDYSGRSVSAAGDLNGDGVDDIIIGAFYANGRAGESYVVFGGTGVGSSGRLALSALDGSNGFVLNGIDGDDRSGWSVSAAGDLNGDGVDDIIIGASGANGRAGESYVVFGGTGVGSSGRLDLSALNGSNGFVLNGIDGDDFSGNSVSAAGDLNGDGVDDIIIGAFYANGRAGESYVVFGGTGVGSSGRLALSALDGSNGFVLNGIDGDDRSGISVSAAGDLNGDGVDDIIIGADGANGFAGESYVVFGGTGVGSSGSLALSALDGSNGFVLNGIDGGIDGGDRSGASVSAAGDLNGDGVDDIIIGALGANGYAGESYVVFGGTGVGSSGSLDLSTLDGSNGFVLNGIDGGDRSGISVSAAGDLNGDGADDIIIGAFSANGGAGESYVVFGGTGVGSSGRLDLSALNGSNGFVLNGIDGGDRSGVSVSAAGDLNGDSVDDIIIGAIDANGRAGESYVVFGIPQATQANDDLLITDEDNALTGNVLADNNLGADEGTNLTITLLNETPFIGLPIPLASGAQLTLNSDGAFTYNPNESFDALDVGDTQTDQFTYTLVGADGVTDTATAFILITGVNDSPIAADDAFFVDENTRFVGNLFLDDPFGQDSDPEGHPLTLETTPVSGPSNGNLVLLPNGGFAYTPNANFEGVDSFEYQISDGNGGSDTATVTLTVLGQNDAPTALSLDTTSIAENSAADTVVGTLSATDPDSGDSFTFSLLNDAGGRFKLPATGAQLLVDNGNLLDFETNPSHTVTVQVTDSGGLSLTQDFDIRVTDLNEAPAITSSASFSVDENSATVGTLTASDPEGDTLTYSLSGGDDRSLFSLDPATGALSFNNAPDFETPGDSNGDNIYEVQAQVSDGVNPGVLQALAITVADLNEAPTITSAASFSVTENSTPVGILTASDPEGDALTYSLSGDDQSLFSLDSVTGALSFISPPDFETPGDSNGDNIYEVQAQVSDGVNPGVLQALAITVADLNEAPTITSAASFSVTENSTPVGILTASDPEGDALTYSLSGGDDQSLFSLDSVTGALSFNTAPDFETPGDSNGDNIYEVQAQVSDGVNPVVLQALAIIVADLNEAPTITSAASFSVTENSTPVGTLTASDPEGDALTYSLSGGDDQSLFSLDPATGALSFISPPDFETPGDSNGDNIYAVKVTVTDATNLTDTQLIDVTVSDVNETPIRLEGEAADTIVNYRTENISAASGGQALSFARGDRNEMGSATFGFNEAPGAYNIIVGTFDENDGLARFTVELNDFETDTTTEIATLELDDNLGSGGANASTAISPPVAFGVTLTPGDNLTVTGLENGNEHARLDYLELVPVI